MTVLLRREGWPVNAKRMYRLYAEEGLTVCTKHRTKAAGRARVPQPGATAPNHRWSMDFMSECLCLLADRSLTGEKVAQALELLVGQRGVPRSITVDNVLDAERKQAVRTVLPCAVGTATLHASATAPNGLPRGVRRCSP
ncbi:MAG: hypothetical protein JSR20_18325 [Nitrospira sp.]|nr:hypothetical protein [Nitrospira sp.]